MESNEHKYRIRLVESINALIYFQGQIFSDALNLLMANEMKEIDEVFEKGDTYEFNIDHLKLSDDANVNQLVKSIELLRESVEILMNSNNITDENLTVG